jgi:dienelactone hydrolase
MRLPAILGLTCTTLLLASCSDGAQHDGTSDAGLDPQLGLPICSESPTPLPVLAGGATVETIPLTIELEAAPRDALLYHPSGATGVPVVLFINGGWINGKRYSWLGQMLASNGYAALIVQETGSGSTSRIYWPEAMIRRLGEPDVASLVDLDRVLLAGHSFGGAIILCLLDQVACVWTAGEIAFSRSIQGAILLSAHLQPPNDPQCAAPIASGDVPVMVASGTADTYSDLNEVGATFARLTGAGERFRVRLEGVNHFQATNCLDPETDDYEQDAPAEVSHEVALERFGKSVLAFMSWKFAPDPSAWTVLGENEGITVVPAGE